MVTEKLNYSDSHAFAAVPIMVVLVNQKEASRTNVPGTASPKGNG